jgi:hypothetical protein
MAAEIIPISTQDYFLQNYNPQETNLIPSFELNTVLTEDSYIEYYVYDNNKNIVYSTYNFSQYTVLANGQSAGSNNEISQIIVDPENSLITSGFKEGEYVTYFNFFNKKIGSNLEQLYISEISSDRTELRLDSTIITEYEIVDKTTNFVIERETSPYFLDFYLNFGNNQLVIANNILLDDQDPSNPTILVKLYEALPENFDINSTLWIVTLVEESVAYQVSFPIVPVTVIDTFPLKGPNFNLDLKDQINNSTVSLNYASLTSTALTSSQNQLQSLLEEKGLDINIDYSDFNNYVHFSSAQVRLENFYYKIQLLEEYNENINLLNSTANTPVYTSSSIAEYESKINNIITYFDDYEYYLYYETGPYAWPKTNSQKPYILAASDSNEVLTWIGNTNPASPYYGGRLLSASLFDNDNKDYLLYIIPEYLRDDPQNKPYETFIQMVGQLYDGIWVYYKDIINKYDNDNRLEYGISKDIVADAIRDFGIKLYQNNFSNEDLYTAFIGLTPQGGLFPFPNITGSLPTPSGFEYVNTLISASNDYMPLDDVNKSLYKRIYHNLPYLLKAKGTLPGLRTLITSYGIPDTVLRINEFGGKDKSNINDWDDWQNVFNYAYHNTGSNNITTNWGLNSSWNSPNNVPSTLEFRFKVPNLTTISGSTSVGLWKTDTNSRIQLRYTGSGLATGSYSGSIIDPYYQYAHLDFFPASSSNPSLSASIYLPFANEGWWSVMATRNGNDFTLHAGNNVYEGGENGTQLGFYVTSSTTVSSTAWTSATGSQFMPQGTEMYLQEIRYYNTVLSESVFKDYIMNPYSSEGNSINSSPDQLAFRLTLGGELYTGSLSVHPKITGSWVATSSFVTNSSASFNFTPTFVPNTEYFFLDQPVVGIKNAIADKIRVENSVIPSGNTLSPFRSLAQNTAASQSYTANTNLLEVAFAPQDEINDDIISQIGYFNIGEFIGDPRQRSSSATSYPDLDRLRNEYFEKYTSNYDLNDYIRLIKFFDNSLFKMIKDFVPARTSLASGVVIKQTLLERNKYPQPQVDINSTIANVGIDNISFSSFIPGNAIVTGSITYPLSSSGMIGLSITGSITEDAIDSQYYIYLYSPTALLATLWDIASSPFSTYPFSGSYYGPIPSGSYIEFSADPLASGFSINNFTASLQLANPYYTPYTTQDIAVSGTVAPQWNDYQPGTIENFSGGTGGTFEIFNGVDTSPYGQNGTGPQNMFGITQSWYETAITPSGSVLVLHDAQDEFYDGEFSGSILTVTTQSLAQSYPLDISSLVYNVSGSATLFTSSILTPSQGRINWQGVTYISSSYVSYLYINETSLDGVNISTALSNLESGNTITFSVSGSVDDGPFQGQPFEATVEGIITSAIQISPSVWRINLSNDPNSLAIVYNIQYPDQFVLYPELYPSSSVYLDPFLNDISNFYNSDYNPLINNVLVDRLNSIYQDVDYSTGIYTPTNFDLLISGSALKAAVQDSNYTSKRVILPRYEGSKSTSQVLNQWIPGDTGTYGKLPTVESLKTMVAYCIDIGGWPPERENASAAFVKYLIKADGTVVIPNTTPNSLADNQETFESGENVLVQYAGTGNQATPIRKIIRGGTRIEPILYTQYGQAPNSTWNTTMSFEDIVPASTGATQNYTALYRRTGAAQNLNYDIPDQVNLNSTTYGTAVSLNSYNISLNAVQDGIQFNIDAQVEIKFTKPPTSGSLVYSYTPTLYVYKNSTPIYEVSYTAVNVGGVSSETTETVIFSNTSPVTLNAGTYDTGDKISMYVKIENNEEYPGGAQVLNSNTSLKISQYPIFAAPVTSSGANSIWGWLNKTTYPYVITSSQTTLVNLYGDPNAKMSNIAGSGFNSIILPWSIKYGDEFKFEGNEDFVYQVGKIFSPQDSGSGRVSQTGSIEVHFNNPLPVSASTSAFNLDHFVIRRYVDEASQILIEGFEPVGATGPYILKPEYIAPELDKGIDEYILILTEKGLI